MTSPVVVQMPNVGQQIQEGLAPLMRALEMRREFQERQRQFELQKERFELEKMQAVKAAELTDEQILEIKSNRKKRELEIKTLEETIAGQQEGMGIIGEISLDLASRNIEPGSDEYDDVIAAARTRATSPYAQKLIDEYAQTQLSSEQIDAQIDQTRQAVSIAASQEERAQATLQQNQRVAAVNERAAVAQEAVRAGVTFGQAADLLGVTIPEELRDINPFSQMAQAKGRGGRSGDMQQRATVFLTMMESSLGPMEVMLDRINEKGGFDRITDAVARTNPKSFWGNLFTSMVQQGLKPEEQAAIAYMRNFVANWQYFASGAQINEGEYSRLVDGFFPRSTDGPLALQAKTAMRTAAINAIRAMATGDWQETPVDPLLQSLRDMKELAQQQNWPADIKAIIDEKLASTTRFRADLMNPNKSIILGSPAFVGPDGQLMNLGGGASSLEDLVDTTLGIDSTTTQRIPGGGF